jgi:hypothetical protein
LGVFLLRNVDALQRYQTLTGCTALQSVSTFVPMASVPGIGAGSEKYK